MSNTRYTNFLDTFSGWLAVATSFFLLLSTSITDILFIAGALLFFLGGRYSEKFLLIWQRRALFLCILLFAWMLLATTYTVATWRDTWHDLIKYDKLLLGVFFLPVLMNEKWGRYALHAFFLAITVTLVVAVLKDVGLLNKGEKYGRFLVFKDRIQTSFSLAMAAYFSLVLFFQQTKKLARWIYAVLSLFSVLLLFSIDGRSGYLIFFILLTWLLWSHWRWRGVVSAILIAATLCVAAYFFSTGFNARVQESIHDLQIYQTGQDNTSLGLRAEFVRNSLQLIKQHPILGTGTGSFSTAYSTLGVPAHLQTQNPHNQYIHILVQWGLVGLGLLLWMFYAQWRDSWLLPSPMREIAQGVVLAIVFGCFANSWILDTTEGHFYIYFIVMAFASQIKVKAIVQLKSHK